MNKAVFLDRDGTINQDKGYVCRVSDFEWIPGVKEALLSLQTAGYLLVVITNQSGVARGYFEEEDVRKLHGWMCQSLRKDNVALAGVYYCPHHPESAVPQYRADCDCRKPKLGLFYRAAKELEIDFDNSIAIGDRMRDLRICEVSACRGYLLGNAESPAPSSIRQAPDLEAAAKDIVSRYSL